MKHIFVGPEEKPSQLLSRLRQETSQRIVLVIPKKAVILKNPENLARLKKKAKLLKKRLAFITNDPRLAKKKKPFESRKAKSKKLKQKILAKTHLPSLTAKAFIVFMLAVFVLAAASLYLVLPKANIIIQPKTEPLIVDLEITVDQNIKLIDLSTNKIPGQLKMAQDQVTKRFPATGKKYLKANAQGIITVYNQSKPQVWREETRFESPTGLIFKTLKFEKIPLGTRDVEVVAEKPGEEYNIPATTFTLPVFKERKDPQYSLIYGKSEKSMSGGFNQEISIVSQEDIEQAKQGLQQELRQKLKKEIGSEVFVEKILKQEASIEPGREAVAFNINLKMSLSTLFFQEKDLAELVKQNLLLRISPDKELIGQPMITYGQSEFSTNQDKMILPLHIEQVVQWKIEPDKLKKQLAGKNSAEVKYLLERQAGVNLVKVNLWPFWVKKVPQWESRIKILKEQ